MSFEEMLRAEFKRVAGPKVDERLKQAAAAWLERARPMVVPRLGIEISSPELSHVRTRSPFVRPVLEAVLTAEAYGVDAAYALIASRLSPPTRPAPTTPSSATASVAVAGPNDTATASSLDASG
jgi:hypothetical protein